MNLANALTISRFFFVPVYLYMFFSNIPNKEYWSLAIVLLAGLTDIADGYIARKKKQITELGIMLDPLADKIMLTTVFISFLFTNKIGIWATLAIVARETAMILGSLFFRLRRKKTVSSNIMGKLSTVLFYMALAAIILNFSFSEIFLWIVIIYSYITTFVYIREVKFVNEKFEKNS